VLIGFLLYIYRSNGINKNLSKILYYDYRGYDREVIKDPLEYFLHNSQPSGRTPPVAVHRENAVKTTTNSNQGEILNLKENCQMTTERDNKIFDNPVINELEIGVDKSVQSVALKGTITVSDYEELSAVELLKLDKRNTLAFLKDRMVLDHSILSLVFLKSLKFPLFIRTHQLTFNLSMQFAVNAMLYTDDVIDARQTNMESVYIHFI
jgi:hypothetical protein